MIKKFIMTATFITGISLQVAHAADDLPPEEGDECTNISFDDTKKCLSIIGLGGFAILASEFIFGGVLDGIKDSGESVITTYASLSKKRNRLLGAIFYTGAIDDTDIDYPIDISYQSDEESPYAPVGFTIPSDTEDFVEEDIIQIADFDYERDAAIVNAIAREHTQRLSSVGMDVEIQGIFEETIKGTRGIKVCLCNGVPVGFISFCIASPFLLRLFREIDEKKLDGYFDGKIAKICDDNLSLKIDHLAIDTPSHGKGYGSMLLIDVLNYGKGKGCSMASLQTTERSSVIFETPLSRFYKGHGFKRGPDRSSNGARTWRKPFISTPMTGYKIVSSIIKHLFKR